MRIGEFGASRKRRQRVLRSAWVPLVESVLCVAAVCVAGAQWGPRVAALTAITGFVLLAIHSLIQESVAMYRMYRQVDTRLMEADSWTFSAMAEAVRDTNIGRRTDTEDLRAAVDRVARRYRQRFRVRWWWWLALAFALPLVGLAVGRLDIDRYGDALPEHVALAPLTWAWIGASLVVLPCCCMYYLSGQLMERWQNEVDAFLDPQSEFLARVRAFLDSSSDSERQEVKSSSTDFSSGHAPNAGLRDASETDSMQREQEQIATAEASGEQPSLQHSVARREINALRATEQEVPPREQKRFAMDADEDEENDEVVLDDGPQGDRAPVHEPENADASKESNSCSGSGSTPPHDPPPYLTDGSVDELENVFDSLERENDPER